MNSTRLANLGLGFNAWDGGLGYTYLRSDQGPWNFPRPAA